MSNNYPKGNTTQLIKETLGVSFTVFEVEALLAKLENQSRSQAPFFEGRLLDKIELLKTALGKNVNLVNPKNTREMNSILDRMEYNVKGETN